MATIAAMAGGAALNAAAFSGTNYLFSKLSDHGTEERKRHDKAIEELQKAQATWTRERQERLDFINERLRQEQHAEKELHSLDDSMQEYYEATSQKLPPIAPYPKLSDYYYPTEPQKTAEVTFIVGGLGMLGFLLFKYT